MSGSTFAIPRGCRVSSDGATSCSTGTGSIGISRGGPGLIEARSPDAATTPTGGTVSRNDGPLTVAVDRDNGHHHGLGGVTGARCQCRSHLSGAGEPIVRFLRHHPGHEFGDRSRHRGPQRLERNRMADLVLHPRSTTVLPWLLGQYSGIRQHSPIRELHNHLATATA